MSLLKYELYHGAVLLQVIKNPSISVKLIDKNDNLEWSAYEVISDDTIHKIFVKVSGKVCLSKSKKPYYYTGFTFNESDIIKLRSIKDDRNLLICLVCADKEICTLNWKDIDDLRLFSKKEATSIRVSWHEKSSIRVKCRGIKLNRTVPRRRLKDYNWVI